MSAVIHPSSPPWLGSGCHGSGVKFSLVSEAFKHRRVSHPCRPTFWQRDPPPTSFYFVCEIEFFAIADGRVCAIFFLFTILFLFHDTEDKIATILKENLRWKDMFQFKQHNVSAAAESKDIVVVFLSLTVSWPSPHFTLHLCCLSTWQTVCNLD